MAKSLSSVLTHSAVTLIGTLVAAVMSVAYVSLGARWLGPAGYGVVGGAVSIANLFFLALNPLEAGITLNVAQLTGRKALPELHAYAARVTRGLALLGVALLAAWIVLALLGVGPSQAASRAASLWLGTFCCAALIACGPRAVMRGRELFTTLAFNVVLEAALRLSLGLALLWSLRAPSAMVAGYALGMLGAIVHGCTVMRRGLPAPEPDPAAPQHGALADASLPLRSLSAPLLSLNLYTVLVSNVDVLAAGHYLAPHEAGLYAGAASLARMVPMAINPLLLVLFSRLATQHAAHQDTAATIRLGALWILAPLGLSLLVPSLGGDLLLTMFLGQAYTGARDVLIYQWATVCVLTVQVFFAESMLATSRVRAGWMFLIPACALILTLLVWHDSAATIARASLIACACVGSAACLVTWWLRAR